MIVSLLGNTRKPIRYCASCKFFHKGVKVSHSHCEHIPTPYVNTFEESQLGRADRSIIKHSGRIPACEFWEAKECKD